MFKNAHLQTTFGKSPFIISHKTKNLLIFVIFTTSFLSGIISPPNPISLEPQIIVEASNITAQKNISKFSETRTTPHQIRQVSIGQSIVPSPTPQPVHKSDDEWGIAKKVGPHTYTILLRPDSSMATPQEILSALNKYRSDHGSGQLSWDDKLADFASSRASSFNQTETLDSHAGFTDFLNNQDGFKKLGFSNLGENSSFGFTLQAVHLIEWVYAGDEEHDTNQLNNDWRYVGIGVSGTATDVVFGGNRM